MPPQLLIDRPASEMSLTEAALPPAPDLFAHINNLDEVLANLGSLLKNVSGVADDMGMLRHFTGQEDIVVIKALITEAQRRPLSPRPAAHTKPNEDNEAAHPKQVADAPTPAKTKPQSTMVLATNSHLSPPLEGSGLHSSRANATPHINAIQPIIKPKAIKPPPPKPALNKTATKAEPQSNVVPSPKTQTVSSSFKPEVFGQCNEILRWLSLSTHDIAGASDGAYFYWSPVTNLLAKESSMPSRLDLTEVASTKLFMRLQSVFGLARSGDLTQKLQLLSERTAHRHDTSDDTSLQSLIEFERSLEQWITAEKCVPWEHAYTHKTDAIKLYSIIIAIHAVAYSESSSLTKAEDLLPLISWVNEQMHAKSPLMRSLMADGANYIKLNSKREKKITARRSDAILSKFLEG